MEQNGQTGNFLICQLCGGSEFTEYLETKDHFMTGEKFRIRECTGCHLLHTYPRPPAYKLAGYYNSDEYTSHHSDRKGLFNSLYSLARKRAIRQKYSLIRRFNSGNSILDIGCANGFFLNYCHRKGMMTMGIEPDMDARLYAISKFGLDVYDEQHLKTIEDGRFDVITLWHVLEHVYDLHDRMTDISRILKKDGHLILALPNFKSHDAGKYGPYWAAWDTPRHLLHFSPETVKYLALNYNFTLAGIFPLKMDAYYVSLLSEKYLNGKKRFFPAIRQGFISNMKASAENVEYSSLMYVLKRKNDLKPL